MPKKPQTRNNSECALPAFAQTRGDYTLGWGAYIPTKASGRLRHLRRFSCTGFGKKKLFNSKRESARFRPSRPTREPHGARQVLPSLFRTEICPFRVPFV